MLKNWLLYFCLMLLALTLFSGCASTKSTTGSSPDITNISSTEGHKYFRELPQFEFGITGTPDDLRNINSTFPSPLQVKYVKQDTVIDKKESSGQNVIMKTSYIFSTNISSPSIYMKIPPGIADTINLIPGDEYTIDHQIGYGWPTVYRLIIYRENVMIFTGVSDWTVDGRLNPNKLIPVKIQQNKLLSGNYVDGKSEDFWERKTNTEIMFTLDENSVYLHQGQVTILGDYEIKLLFAREIQYKSGWYDVGQNAISYVIYRNT
jgi:hypothetical protein